MSTPTILLVDDEPLIRWSLAERLKAEDCDVLEADSGQALTDRLSDGLDLVLLDHRLPDTDGLSLLRQLKTFKPDIPVILITAEAGPGFDEEAVQRGAYDVLGKPFDLDDVARVVNNALGRRRGGCRRSASTDVGH